MTKGFFLKNYNTQNNIYSENTMRKTHKIKIHFIILQQCSLSTPETEISHLSVSAFFHGENIYQFSNDHIYKYYNQSFQKKIAYINIHKINTEKYRTAYCNMKLFLKI